jgi:hypothetical protein
MTSMPNHAHSVSLGKMRSYLSRSLSSVNRNKVNGILAEIDFRNYVGELGFGERVSEGGWITRCKFSDDLHFAQNTIVFFPETVVPDHAYRANGDFAEPPRRLHTICATFHQIGIRSYYCVPVVTGSDDEPSINWWSAELGRPDTSGYQPFPECIGGFEERRRRYNFLHYENDVRLIPDEAIPIEFSKESLRISFVNRFYAEISDVDGLFWGQERTYPIEVKEKTRATDRDVGDYFGIDIGPFVKLAYYAARRGNLHSMFVVREIGDESNRDLVAWRFITFEDLARYASWNFRAGGRSMTGGRSATVRIPADQFRTLNSEALSEL